MNDKLTRARKAEQLDLFGSAAGAAPIQQLTEQQPSHDPAVDEGAGWCGNRWLRTGYPWERD